MTTFGKLALATTFLVLAAAGAALLWGHPNAATWGGEQTDFAYVRGDIVAVGARVAGYAVDVPADDNRVVRAGEVLLRIDPRDYQAAVERAERTLDQSKALLAQSRARLPVQHSRILSARASRAATGAQTVATLASYRRTAELVQTGFLSPSRFDDVRATRDAALAQSAQVDASVQSEEQQLQLIQAEIQAGVANVAQSQAALAMARLALADTEIRAPVDGTVANRRVRAGEYVAVGTRLMSVVPQQGLWIEANFRETQLRDLKPGAAMLVQLDSQPDKRWCGRIESLGPASGSEFALLPADNATGNFTKIVRRLPVRVTIEGTGGVLKPGLSARVRHVDHC